MGLCKPHDNQQGQMKGPARGSEVQRKAGWSSEQPVLVEGIHAHGREAGTR